MRPRARARVMSLYVEKISAQGVYYLARVHLGM